MIKPLFNVFSRNDTHTRFALFGKIYFLAFRNKRWSERKSREIIATKRQAKDDRFFFPPSSTEEGYEKERDQNGSIFSDDINSSIRFDKFLLIGRK